MKSIGKLAILGVFFVLLVSPQVFAAEKSVETEARKYVLRGESASYFILNTTDGEVFYVVQIDDKNSFVFDDNVEVVLDETTLAEVLKEYYAQSGATGFTDASKAELLDKFNQSDVLFNNCHTEFYEFVETNFFWSQYRCVDTATGQVCDAAFAQRKRWKNAWDIYKAKVQLLKSATTREDIASALEQIEAGAIDAKNQTLAMDDAGIGYAYFLGDTMDKDAECLFNYGLLDGVISLSSAAMRNQITDVEAEAIELKRIYNTRKDVFQVKEIQDEGRELLEKAINLTVIVPGEFGPLDDGVAEIEENHNKLREATTLDSATNYFNLMKTKYDELEALVNDPSGLLFAYNETITADAAAENAIAQAREKYGADDTRVIDLDNERKTLSEEINGVKLRLGGGGDENATAVTVDELKALTEIAENIRVRAANMPSKQNELDLVTISAIVVLVATVIGIVIYVVKFRKKRGGGKEIDYKTVMGSGGHHKAPEKEKVDEEQHRRAMFPKL